LLPSNPSHGQIEVFNGHDYSYDSDSSRWIIIRHSHVKTLRDDLDSDVFQLHFRINGSSNSSGYPVGSVIPFAKSNLPEGFILADGSVFNELLYPDLYAYLGSNVLPDYSVRSLYYKTVDLASDVDYDEVVFGIAAYNGAGFVSDSEAIYNAVQQRTSELDSDILVLQAEINTLKDDLAQAVTDRVFTDNQLSARLDGHDSDLDNKGRFYVQATPPSGGPNSGWVNTNTLKLHIWDESIDTWVEVTLT